jgi:hypothetical protein
MQNFLVKFQRFVLKGGGKKIEGRIVKISSQLPIIVKKSI